MTHLSSLFRSFACGAAVAAVVAFSASAFGQSASSGLGVLGLASSLGNIAEEKLATIDFTSNGSGARGQLEASESAVPVRPTAVGGVRFRPALPGEATARPVRSSPVEPAPARRDAVGAPGSRSPVGELPSSAPIRPSVRKSPIRPGSDPVESARSTDPSRPVAFSNLLSQVRDGG